jgi:hypothetical protein
MSQHIASKTALLALAVSLIGACATQIPGSRVSAKVVAMRTGATDARGLEPVAGAHLTVACPAKEARELGTTQADGTLKVDADAAVTTDCTLAVAHAGHRPVKMQVANVCNQWAGTSCRALDVRAVMQAEAGAESAGATH